MGGRGERRRRRREREVGMREARMDQADRRDLREEEKSDLKSKQIQIQNALNPVRKRGK